MYIQNGVSVIILKLRGLRKIGKSMRVHVFSTLLFVAIVPLVLGMFYIVQDGREQAMQKRKENMIEKVQELASTIALSGYLNNSNQPEITVQMQVFAELYEGRILLADSGLVIQRDTYGMEEGKTLISEEAILGLRGEKNFYYNKTGQSMEMTVPITQGTDTIGALVVSYSVEDIIQQQAIVQKNIAMILVLTIILGGTFAFIVSKMMTRPYQNIVNSIHHINEGYLEERVSIQGYSEAEQIADAFNHTLEQIKTIEDSRQEFVSNVSHELKTPLTSIQVLADALVAQPDAPIEMYQEFMQDIHSEIIRETKIVNDLLSLVKLDRKAGEMHIAEVSINELIKIIMKRLSPLAKQRGIEMVFESFRPVLAEIDEVKMSLVFTNLVENAIKYNRDGGFVKVSLNADHKYFYVKVEDSGEGIPEEEQRLIFDRFYRVDKARSRETGGTGLGLSITKSAVIMHKGSIRVSSVLGEGSVFTIKVPLSFTL